MASRNPYVGLDSQSLSYLLDAVAGISEPIDVLQLEKKALVRSWFYKPGDFSFILTETVVSEVSKISNIERREFHESFIRTLFLDYPVRDINAVQARAEEFQKYHVGFSDCLILAEAEDIGLDILITYDHDFWRRLQNVSHTTKIMKPNDYWLQLGIPKGATPTTVPYNPNPEDANPLSFQQWWRW